MWERLLAWAHRNMPTRETFENNRFLRPMAHRILHPALWRFHRRSVARGVALGMFVGIIVPVAQTVFAALLALPTRANVPVAAATTFVTNPLTTPPIWAFAWWIGRRILGTTPDVAAAQPRATGWVEWLMHDVGPALGLGLVIVGIVGAGAGYLLASLGWRWWIGRKWRHRLAERREARP